MPVFDPFSDSAAVQSSLSLIMGDRPGISLPGGGIVYLLRDTFSVAIAAGSVNGTTADTGQTRTVTDTNSKLSISGGQAVAVTGGAAVGDPGVWYPAITRVSGMILLGSFTVTAATMDIGWDVNAAGAVSFSVRPVLASAFTVRDNSTAISVAAAPANGTTYQAALVLRPTGVWYFVKGGAFTYWTLIWISSVGSGNYQPSFITGGTTDAWTVDDIRVPANITFIPNPLAYDTFTRADGALGSTETTGPDSQAISALVWTFTSGVWTISTNKAIATPVAGSDVIVNGAFAADTDWNKGAGWAIGSGTANATTSSADLTATVAPLTANRWYQVQYTVSGFSAGTVQAVVGGSTSPPTHAANATYTETALAGTTAFVMRGAGFTGSIDNVSAKPLTTAELFSSVQVSKADVVAEVAITLTGGGGGGVQAGMVLNLDSTSNPQNFILVYLNGNGFSVVQECVAGVYTTKVSTSVTYSAGAILRCVREGTQLRLFYNGSASGAAQTMSVNTNTLAGLFCTSPLNSLDNFLIWPRGSGGEFSTLDLY